MRRNSLSDVWLNVSFAMRVKPSLEACPASKFPGLEMGAEVWESRTMSAAAIREKRQTTLPADVSEAAGLEPGDQVDWRFEDGEIRGRKLVHQPELKRIVRKLVQKDGELVMDTTGLTIDEDDIATAVREERDRH